MTALQAFGGSVHSQSERQGRRPPTWDGSPATDFAITTVNVPDRLDVQEVRARAEEDEYSRRSWFSLDRYVVQLWLKRLLMLGVLGALGYFGWQAAEPLSSQFDAAAIGDRLTKAAGRRVTVGARSFRVTPTPRMVLSQVDIGSQVTIDEIALHFNWDEAVRAVKAGGWAWGEAEVSPLALDQAKASALLGLLPTTLNRLPASVSTLRFAALEFPQFPLLPGRYQSVLRRDAGGQFGPLVLEQAGADGSMKVTVTPGDVVDAAAGDTVRFQLEAQRWVAPVGPVTPWSEFVASGRVREDLIFVDSYTAAGFYGVTQGTLVAAHDVAWSITGTARSSGIDLEALFRNLRGASGGEAAAEPRSPMVGTAAMTLVAGGHGGTFQEAVDNVRLSGPVQVRWGALNGINLGLAATQGGAAGAGAGGLTRFTELEAAVVVDRGGVLVRDITGRAGAMATRGEISVSPSLALNGALRVDLGATRVQAPINVRVRGTALAPQFGR